MFARLMLVLFAMPLFSGCEYAAASQEARPAQTLWSEADAQEALAILRAVRQDSKTLQAIRNDLAEVKDTVGTLNGKFDTSLLSIEGLEQRLDNPATVKDSLTVPLAVSDTIQLFGDTPPNITPPAPPMPEQVTPNNTIQCENGQCVLRTRTVSVQTPAASSIRTRTVSTGPVRVQQVQQVRQVQTTRPSCRLRRGRWICR